MGEGFYRRSLAVSTVVHTSVIVAALLFAFVRGCLRPRHTVIPIDFTVVVPSDDASDTPERPEDPRPPDPAPPDRLPDEPDRVPDPRKPPVQKPPERKPPEQKPPARKPIVKGPRIVRGPKNTPAKPTLSDKEIQEWLLRGARPGATDSLPPDEQTRNFMLVRNAFYDAWDQPSRAEAGERPAELEFALDAAGRVSAPRIVQSSGSAAFDASVLEAGRAVGRVSGLSARFLRQYPRLSVEFRLQP